MRQTIKELEVVFTTAEPLKDFMTRMEMKVGFTFACLNLKKLAKTPDKRQGYTDFLRDLFDVLLSFLYFNPQKEKSRFSTN